MDENIDKWTLDVFELGKAAGGRPIVPLAYFIFKVECTPSHNTTSHNTLTQHHLTQHHLTAPPHTTPPHTAPPHSTLTQHHLTAPSHNTTSQHPHTAPPHSTLTQHHLTAPHMLCMCMQRRKLFKAFKIPPNVFIGFVTEVEVSASHHHRYVCRV